MARNVASLQQVTRLAPGYAAGWARWPIAAPS